MARTKTRPDTTHIRVTTDIQELIDRDRGSLSRTEYIEALLLGKTLPIGASQAETFNSKLDQICGEVARLSDEISDLKQRLRSLDPDLHMAIEMLNEVLDGKITGEEYIVKLDALSHGLDKEDPISDEKRLLLMGLLQAEANRDMVDWTEDERKEVETMARTIRERLKKPSE